MPGTAQSAQYARVFAEDETPSSTLATDLLSQTATLNTPTTRVEVAEVSWLEPTVLRFRVDRPVFTLLLSVSTDSIETEYVGEGSRRLNPVGGVVFAPPDREMLSRSRSAAGKLSIVTCSFDRDYSQQAAGSFSHLSRSQLLKCLDVRSSLIPSILLRLMSEALRPGFMSTAIAESLGHAVLIECAQVILSKEPKRQERGRLTVRQFRIIDEYMAGLSFATPSISEVATLCGVSERHLTKCFRAQMNQSIGRYMRHVQIAKARAYLLETELPLKEISYRLGFSAPANFSIAFRAATGQTPGQFRTGGTSL